MNVIVIGGGIVGLASAYYLVQRDIDVTVCERGTIGGGSTERSVGGIRAQFSTPVNIDLSLASMRVWESFEEKFGVDITYRRNGYLFLARSEETAHAFHENVAMQNERGVPSEFLMPEETCEYCPKIDTGAFVGATYSPTDGFADPHLALQGFSEAATETGVEIRTKTPVTDIHLDDKSVRGVTAGGDRLDAEYVVNTAGPWAGRVASMAGIDIPVAPKRRQMLVVDPEQPVPESVPLTIDLDSGSHFRPERKGAALVGGHFGDPDPDEDPNGYAQSFDLDWAAEALERAADCTRYFGPDSRIRRGWAGLYAVTPDHHPIIEETVPGFINAVGFSGHGFQHAPATGQLVTELAVDGRASLVDISPLRYDRFEAGDLQHERNVA
jgi:sarcosine oxidase subunit beta